MNIIMWMIQIILALFCVSGSVWRFLNYEQAAKDIASMGALPYGIWNVIGAFEIVCAFGLILPQIFGFKSTYVGLVAMALAIELLLISGLHIKYFGFQLMATNPAVWSLSLCLLAAFVAYSRLKLTVSQ